MLTAAFYNVNVRDNLNELAPFFATWTDYTPTWTQGVAVTHTKTYARFMKIGKIVWVSVRLVATGSGTGANQISVSIPQAALRGGTGDFNIAGAGMYIDVSVPTNHVLAVQLDVNSVRFATDTGAGNYFGANPAVTAASGDFISFNICYEIA